MHDRWNLLEFLSYIFFMIAFFSRVRMLFFALELQEQVSGEGMLLNGGDHLDLQQFSFYNYIYMFTICPNAMLMWLKLFKYLL